jgi:hypothetical protein
MSGGVPSTGDFLFVAIASAIVSEYNGNNGALLIPSLTPPANYPEYMAVSGSTLYVANSNSGTAGPGMVPPPGYSTSIPIPVSQIS